MNQMPISTQAISAVIAEHLELAEEQLREALTKAMIFKNNDFLRKLRNAHETVKELIEEAQK